LAIRTSARALWGASITSEPISTLPGGLAGASVYTLRAGSFEALHSWYGRREPLSPSGRASGDMRARLDLARQKGCDAVDPDNVDGYTTVPPGR
jgi:hypothetical protein